MQTIVQEVWNQDMHVLLVCAMHLFGVFGQIIYLLCLSQLPPSPQEKVVITIF